MAKSRSNEFDQPIGPDLDGWKPPEFPLHREFEGKSVKLEPLDRDRHARALYDAYQGAPDAIWTYVTVGPFRSVGEWGDTIDTLVAHPDWQP